MIEKSKDEYNTHVIITNAVGEEYNYSISNQRVDVTAEDCLCDIYQQMYPGAVVTPTEDQTSLEAFEAWIAAGHTNPEVLEGYEVKTPAKVIAKKPWKSTHPLPTRVIDGRKVSQQTIDQFNLATTVDELKEVLSLIIFGRIPQ